MRSIRWAWILGCATLALVSSSAAEETHIRCPSLTSPQYSVGLVPLNNHPKSVAFGDFDGDGFPDLATANGNGDTVSVLRNERMGFFADHVDYEAGAEPWGVAVGDLDGDGDIDLVVGNYGAAEVSVLMNNGNGTFGQAVNYAVENTTFGVTLADLNDDGYLDLATANLGFFSSGTTVSVLLNEGDGTFGDYVAYVVGNGPTDVHAGDLDGDGFSDLVVTNSSSDSISVLLNTSRGSFEPAQNYDVGDAPKSTALGDFDADGDLDMAVALRGDDAGMIVLRNDGDGTFEQVGTYELGSGSEGITTGDYDTDGDLDLAVVNAVGWDVAIMLNNGDATFQQAGHLYAVGADPQIIATADVDGDGDLDLAVGSGGGDDGREVTVLLNGGAGVFLGSKRYYPAGEPNAMVVGDLDGDGDNDLIVLADDVGYWKHFHVLLNDGTGDFRFADDLAFEFDTNSLALGDVDSDGDLDLAVHDNCCGVTIMFNNGNGGFPPSQWQSYELVLGDWVILDDINGDGFPDLIAAGNWVLVLLNLGDGSFDYPNMEAYNIFDEPLAAATGDFDNDGDRDLAVVNFDTGEVSVLTNSGDGTFPSSVRYPVAAEPISIASADLDGDGDDDLVIGSDCTANVSVLISDGDSGFAPVVYYEVTANTRSLVTTDVDLDGDQDILVGALSSAWVLVNSGDGTFPNIEQYAGGYGLNLVVTGELNGDGYPDAVVNYFLGSPRDYGSAQHGRLRVQRRCQW